LKSSCSKVVPSHQPLSDWQKTDLELISSYEGLDVVLELRSKTLSEINLYKNVKLMSENIELPIERLEAFEER
jgi:hypothetical protein